MTGIRLEHLTKRFKNQVAVEDVSADIRNGEFVVILGASGSGKTTILRMIAGLEVQTSGHVYIGDMLVDDYEPRDRNIAMVFQTYALYPHLSVRKNIGFGLKVRHVERSEIDRRVTAVAELLGISETLDRRPSELSGGQRQRVALGRAIVRDPEAFLLDEPLSNLDAKIRSSARIELKRLHSQLGQTFVFVTHDQTEAMTLGDRLAVMNHGRLLQYDTPERVLSHPTNRFVASFVGSPEMDFLEGSVEPTGGSYTFISGPIQIPVRGVGRPGPVTIGLRPWDITVHQAAGAGSVPARVAGVERLGSSDQVFLEVGPPGAPGPGGLPAPPLTLRALVRSYDFEVGNMVSIGFDADRALYFTADGNRIESMSAPTRVG